MKSPFEQIPGVGRSIAHDFERMGFKQPEDLVGQDAEELYQRLMALDGHHIDRCVLYTFRCAVYFVSHNDHEPEKLKWWNWKDPQAPKSNSKQRIMSK